MKYIIAKQVKMAEYANLIPRIVDETFRNLQEKMGKDPSYTQKYDSGLAEPTRLNVIRVPGMGTNDRGGVVDGLGREEPEKRERGLSSWYNEYEEQNMKQGDQWPSDETGPGNSHTTPKRYNVSPELFAGPGDPIAFDYFFNDGSRDSLQGHQQVANHLSNLKNRKMKHIQ